MTKTKLRLSGWWFQPPEKYWSVGVTIPNIWKNKIHVPNNQPAINQKNKVSKGDAIRPQL
jgi:hypothetical protein